MSSHDSLGEVAKVEKAFKAFMAFHLAAVSKWLEVGDLMQGQSREAGDVSLFFAGIYAESRLHAIGRFALGFETKQAPSFVMIAPCCKV
jgi:hypothetical protein